MNHQKVDKISELGHEPEQTVLEDQEGIELLEMKNVMKISMTRGLLTIDPLKMETVVKKPLQFA